MKIASLLCLFLFLPAFLTAAADDKKDRKEADHELAMTALRNGEVIPIMNILALVQTYQPGEVIEVELESKKGALFYEIEVLSNSGSVEKLKLDARTGALVIKAKSEDE